MNFSEVIPKNTALKISQNKERFATSERERERERDVQMYMCIYTPFCAN